MFADSLIIQSRGGPEDDEYVCEDGIWAEEVALAGWLKVPLESQIALGGGGIWVAESPDGGLWNKDTAWFTWMGLRPRYKEARPFMACVSVC